MVFERNNIDPKRLVQIVNLIMKDLFISWVGLSLFYHPLPLGNNASKGLAQNR